MGLEEVRSNCEIDGWMESEGSEDGSRLIMSLNFDEFCVYNYTIQVLPRLEVILHTFPFFFSRRYNVMNRITFPPPTLLTCPLQTLR